MAADYSPNMTWPIEKLALQKKILGYEGIHVTFENGRRYPNETRLPVPQPLYLGDTFRVFCYTGDLSGKNVVGVYYSDLWHAEIHVKKQDDKHARMEANWFLETAFTKGENVFVGNALARDIHSLAFRVEASGSFMFYHDEIPLKPFNFKKIINYEFSMIMHLESHSVLSYHFSQETNDPFPEPSRPYMNAVPMSVGSYAEFTLIFNGPGRDLQVTQSGSSVTFTAPGTLTPGEAVQCILRIGFSGYVASASFDDTPLTIAATSPRWLEPTFSGDFSLRKAHTHVAD